MTRPLHALRVVVCVLLSNLSTSISTSVSETPGSKTLKRNFMGGDGGVNNETKLLLLWVKLKERM